MRRTLIRLLMVCGTSSLLGCVNSVILVPAGTPVQLAEPVHAHVFIVQTDGTKVRSSDRVEIPAGWWAAEVPEDNGVKPSAAP